MKAGATLMALLLLAGAAWPASSTDAPPRAIVPAESLRPKAIDDYGQRAEPPYWTPSPDEVLQAESRLQAALQKAEDPRAQGIRTQLEHYGRQYFGITIAGRRTLVVNAFCGGWSGRDLTASVLKVWDGGACYFAAYYDVAEGQFIRISVNAEG